MVTITYVESNGDSYVVDVDAGMSVMKGAVKNGVHVFVDPAWHRRARRPDHSST